VVFKEKDNILHFFLIFARRTMEGKRWSGFKTIRTEMWFSGTLEKTAAAETVGTALSSHLFPTSLANNPFLGGLKQIRTQLAERREENQFR